MMKRLRDQMGIHEVSIELLVEQGFDPAMGRCRFAARSSDSSRTRSPTTCSAAS
jgi:hypothetical protein